MHWLLSPQKGEKKQAARAAAATHSSQIHDSKIPDFPLPRMKARRAFPLLHALGPRWFYCSRPVRGRLTATQRGARLVALPAGSRLNDLSPSAIHSFGRSRWLAFFKEKSM